MSTINLDLYVLWQRDRFVTSLTNPAVPTLPTVAAGDTVNANIYFVDDGSPLQIHRFAGSDVSALFYAVGNNHAYGDSAPGQTELGPASNAIGITRYQAGVKPGTSEIQRVLLPATPVGGSYTLNFPGPTVVGAPSGIAGPKGSVTIYFDWTITQIQDAIRALPFYDVFNAILQDAPGYNQFLVVTGTPTDYHIDYGNGSDRQGPLDLCTVTSNALQFLYGWAVSFVAPSDFADLFLSANGPSFFQVILDGGQAAFIQLSSDPGGGNTPAFTDGPPPNSGSVGSSYSFAYSASGFPAPTFSLTSGTLPSGLNLTSGGLLSGTPSSAGTFTGVVTATNSGGSVTQAFSITIGGAGGGSPGPGGVGRLASYRDGNFNVLDSSDGPYLEDRNDEWPGLLIWHIPMCIDFDDYLASVPAVGSYEGPFGYFWKDTTFKFIGDGIVAFERLRHNIPGDANRIVYISKNYQAGLYTFTSGALTDIAIDSFSRSIKANCNYHYALDDPGILPVVPFVQIIPFLHGQAITDLGTGFPTAVFNGQTLYNNNFGVLPIDNGGDPHVLGRLYCRRIITG